MARALPIRALGVGSCFHHLSRFFSWFAIKLRFYKQNLFSLRMSWRRTLLLVAFRSRSWKAGSPLYLKKVNFGGSKLWVRVYQLNCWNEIVVCMLEFVRKWSTFICLKLFENAVYLVEMGRNCCEFVWNCSNLKYIN